MRTAWLSLRDRMDRVGITLSGLCLLHCVAGLLLVTVLGIGGQWLLAPMIHRIGLALAIAVGLLTIGVGVLRHGQLPPLIVGTIGLLLMGGGLFVEHGMEEAVLTISGVVLLAVAHILNLRHAH
ncbi:MerC domain-containing protein [Caenibius sp. WL]|uniref:MerC domain-containing protein n=1 Tax=Caenibius sp. WL TaxID=2872646 RepID=UPI001C9995B2|nr:MerC domain-containing protein [Caenibius sp. WL]QZP08675.1 MerC domain-containing protein [Caenibius sp. WL]